MNPLEAESQYKILRSGLDAGTIPLDEFNLRVSGLRYRDHTGTWWTINPIDGSWLRWNGTAWEIGFGSETPSAAAWQQGAEKGSAGSPAAGVRSMASGSAWPAGRKYAAGSLACGVIAVFLFPYIVGCAGIVLGIIAVKEKYMAGAAGILLSAVVISVALLISGHFSLPL
jgi:hypothetical protein